MTYKTLKAVSFTLFLGGVVSFNPLSANAENPACKKALHSYHQLVKLGKNFERLVGEFKHQVSKLSQSDLSQFDVARADFDNKVSALPQTYGVNLSQYPSTVETIKNECPKEQWPKKLIQ